MSFSNEKGEHLVLEDYKNVEQPTLFLVYKTKASFYIILINAEYKFDETIIKILNLN